MNNERSKVKDPGIVFHKRIGIKEGYSIKLINEPEKYSEVVGQFNGRITFQKKLKEPVDLIHLFTKSKNELSVELPYLKKYIKNNGSIWISWPKRSSNAVSDLDSLMVRKIGMQNGLIAEDICSFDNTWFAIKLIQKTEGGSC